jgi:DNA-binding NtrC family response regulator
MDSLNILYFAPKPKGEDAFWPAVGSVTDHIYATSDFVTARHLLNEHEFQVGLVQFGPEEDKFLQYGISDIVHHHRGSSMAWVALVASDSIENDVLRQVIADHFCDYHTLPANTERLRITLGHASRMADLRRQTQPRPDGATCKGDLIGASPAMEQVARGIDKVGRYELPVLISGESGTGKELAALAIHRDSARADGPFVTVNCGALPPNLIQSELFGHEKGAFTGAHQRKLGLLEQATQGTLFLDEIGELPLDLQANLLRVLQQKTLYRVGGREEIPLDVRIVSATHVDLETAVQCGRFREDLYYRLNVLRVPMPPLRERDRDIELLAQHFLATFKKNNPCKARGFSKRALQAMRKHPWPGNVRELKNRVERALVMCDHYSLTPTDLGLENGPAQPQPLSLRAAKENAEKEALLQALARTGNSVPTAARSLDVSHVTLYRLIKKHGIDIAK